MSRIANAPVTIPKGVEASLSDGAISVKGSKGNLNLSLHDLVAVVKDGEKLKASIKKGHSNINSMHLIDIGCALGIHAGPGSLATAIQPV